VELIQRALTIGFSLAELKTILTVRDKGGAPCRHVRALMDEMHANRLKRLQVAGFTQEQAEEISRLHTPNFM